MTFACVQTRFGLSIFVLISVIVVAQEEVPMAGLQQYVGAGTVEQRRKLSVEF